MKVAGIVVVVVFVLVFVFVCFCFVFVVVVVFFFAQLCDCQARHSRRQRKTSQSLPVLKNNTIVKKNAVVSTATHSQRHRTSHAHRRVKDWQRRASDRHWIQPESDSQRCFLKRQTKTKANRLNNTVTRKKTNNKKQKNNKLNNKQASIKQTRVQSVHAAPEAVDRGAASCRRNRRSTSRRRRRRWLCQSTLRKQQQDQIF